MATLSTGGGSSAVAASAHSGCERYRHTDPLVVGKSRRAIADSLGKPDTSAGIPEARWMRAMQFERLVRHEDFVSPLLTTAIGALGLERPTKVRRADGGVSVTRTQEAIERAHEAAISGDAATMITSLAIPFVGMEDVEGATPAKPDFAIVAPRRSSRDSWVVDGSWLIMGDAKDYERVRSRIDDQRMLKGFLQVALGAESAASWSVIPEGMVVHDWGALAVPRNSFLQPEPVVELLDDHREEVRGRVAERTSLLDELGSESVDDSNLSDFVDHLEATFDPSSCPSCSLFNFCRAELRDSGEEADLLVEIGVRPEYRPGLTQFLEHGQPDPSIPDHVVAPVIASSTGRAQWTGQKRVDPAGTVGSMNAVLAKSESGALAVHGLGVQRVLKSGGTTDWQFQTFDVPQSSSTRLAVMRLLGDELAAILDQEDPDSPETISVVVPDRATADVLVSIADSLAGIETSRLRWERDVAEGREALTFNGAPASIPAPLSDSQRLAVSFLLEEDRARAMKLRWPLVNLRSAVAAHVVPGGPAVDAGRLDYLIEWSTARDKLDHRSVSDAIADSKSTPGARLSNSRSDELHELLRSGGSNYHATVVEELEYKAQTIDRSIAFLESLEDSKTRPVHRALERDAQTVWRRRLKLQASDLVRFGRTNWVWRNNQVELLEKDDSCSAMLSVLGSPSAARDAAVDAGNRHVSMATVTSESPLRISVASRRFGEGTHVVAVRVRDEMSIETTDVDLAIQAGSFKFSKMPIAPLSDYEEEDGSYRWGPGHAPIVEVGDQLVVADASWLLPNVRNGVMFSSGHEIAVDRPKQDDFSAPKPDCHEHSYEYDPDEHKYCCRSHAAAESEWSDELARRRANGELNPDVWPPVADDDGFDTAAAGSATGDSVGTSGFGARPADLTIDDLE